MPSIRLLTSELDKAKFTAEQERQIRALYREAQQEMREWERHLENRTNISSAIRRIQLAQLEREMKSTFKNIGGKTKRITTDTMYKVAESVCKDANGLLGTMGLSITGAYGHIPKDVVQSIVTGKIYEGDWSLSRAIWNLTDKNNKDIHNIIAKGVLENKSSYDIAKDLEKYVNPDAAKPWDWSNIYPGTSKKVDYNAQRLARTLTSHAYQQSFIRSTHSNPFIEGYEWLSAGDHRVCETCNEYENSVHAVGFPPGVFLKDDVPMDHPNGRCTLAVYIEQDTDSIVDSLVDWAHGEPNSELDQFARSLGYNIDYVKSRVKK